MQTRIVFLNINGRRHAVALEPNVTLLQALHGLGYTDVKNGCEKGDCGACAVLLDGQAVNSCLTLAWQADGATIVTAAGLGTLAAPHPLQEAFADTGAIQCGYCTPGLIISAAALLDQNPQPTESEIREALSGNLCRCTGYGQVVRAVQEAAERMRGRGGVEEWRSEGPSASPATAGGQGSEGVGERVAAVGTSARLAATGDDAGSGGPQGGER